ncbi:MAG TPA: NapC/NirT family cytochrome c [Pyrinomonadaceae bacterium]|nr:NapC/NirT family cytochrome c [Pyrinomonadaceae bacterium]
MSNETLHINRPADDAGPAETALKPPSLFRNYISLVGGAIVIASFVSICLLFLIEITSSHENPYLGILTYIILPSILIFGLVTVMVGRTLERRRRHRTAPDETPAYPSLNLNDPRSRKAFLIFLVMTFVFVSASAFGSYRGYEYTESVNFCGETCHSVMSPEFAAYKAGSHAKVECVACHVGSGPGWYVKMKINGAHQLYSLAFNKYSRPIPSPVHNLRPANDTCEHCHWSEKFYGDEMKVFDRYGYDEQNTLRKRRMLIHVGGGSAQTGLVAGIHWHMNVANEITFVSTDGRRQVIPWIRVKDRQGDVTEYYDRNHPATAEQIAKGEARRMDCIDCHNRPAHNYLPPDAAVDLAFAAGRLDPSLPYLKKQSVEVLTKSYNTTPQAVADIATAFTEFYSKNYPDVYAQKRQSVDAAIAELQRIFQTYFFPEMKTDWQSHPNNIGHLYFSGCFRCHDGDHVSKDGKTISNNCNICHTMIYDSANPEASVKTGPFLHPVDLGSLADRKCEFCHKPNQPFQHPINLGDISMFQCAECHRKDEPPPQK